jgi:hypothetical protein
MIGLGGEQVTEADQFVAAQGIIGSGPSLDFSDTLSEPGLKILTVFGCCCRREDLLAGPIGQNEVRVGDCDPLKQTSITLLDVTFLAMLLRSENPFAQASCSLPVPMNVYVRSFPPQMEARETSTPTGADRFKQITRPEFHQSPGQAPATDVNTWRALAVKCILIPHLPFGFRGRVTWRLLRRCH